MQVKVWIALEQGFASVTPRRSRSAAGAASPALRRLQHCPRFPLTQKRYLGLKQQQAAGTLDRIIIMYLGFFFFLHIGCAK